MDILTPSTTEDTDSPSSLTVETPISGSQDQILPKENEIDDKNAEEERKLRRLERRKALALARGPGAPKLGNSGNNTIDLTNEDDDPSNRWFKKTFNTGALPKKPKSPEDSKKFAVPRHIGKHVPKSLLVRETLQNKLKASMSVKRRKAQEERRKMYEEDNEHLKVSSEEEEEEEVVIKKKKTKKPEEEYNSDDDEDYKPPEEEKEDDEMSVNLLNDSFTFDVFNHAKKSGPGSVFSIEESPEEKVPTMSQLFGGGGESQEDLLNFCSGKFEEFPDTLQMLLGEGKKKASEGSESVVEASKDVVEPAEGSENEDGPLKSKKKPKSKVLDSDDEEEAPESIDVFAGSTPAEEEEELPETVPEMHRTRVVISEDEDSEEEEEEAEDAEDEEEPEEEPEEEEPEEEDNAPEPNFDDEDDELAVIKRIEHQEYKKQIKKRTLFDDEASLSGDDVGSDLEDEEGVENAYEAEEGDADDVPDDDTIRKQNFRMLLKQENDKETRALAKLQERLLADGDLGGVETNRQFRFKLREEMEIKIGMGDDGAEEQQEDEEPEEDEEKKKERAEMIKYRIEHAEELLLLEQTHSNEDDAIFARAGRMMMRKTEKVATEEVAGSFQKHLKPSLLSKTALAVSFQEVLNSGGAAPKQMYVQNFDGERRQSSGVKRGLTTTTPPKSAAKRVRSSKLSSLE